MVVVTSAVPAQCISLRIPASSRNRPSRPRRIRCRAGPEEIRRTKLGLGA